MMRSPAEAFPLCFHGEGSSASGRGCSTWYYLCDDDSLGLVFFTSGVLFVAVSRFWKLYGGILGEGDRLDRVQRRWVGWAGNWATMGAGFSFWNGYSMARLRAVCIVLTVSLWR